VLVLWLRLTVSLTRRYVMPLNVEPSPLGIGTYALSGPAVGGASVATTGRCWVTVLGRDSGGG
jgi:hypothetical protein